MLRLFMFKGGKRRGMYCPVGAEGYNANGDLAITSANEGWLRGASGQVVFKTAKDYGNVDCIPGLYSYFVLAGGGSSGVGGNNQTRNAGGGGAGGRRKGGVTLSDTVAITVGAGGLSAGTGTTDPGNDGNDSVLGAITAKKGGGGGSRSTDGGSQQDGRPGGSGGGGGVWDDTYKGTGGAGEAEQGHDGANAADNTSGGGGGISGAASGKNAGAGEEYSGFTYGVGGAGTDNSSAGTGNQGVGAANTGNGGAVPRNINDSYAGGSGIVIVRWGDYSHNYDPSV